MHKIMSFQHCAQKYHLTIELMNMQYVLKIFHSFRNARLPELATHREMKKFTFLQPIPQNMLMFIVGDCGTTALQLRYNLKEQLFMAEE